MAARKRRVRRTARKAARALVGTRTVTPAQRRRRHTLEQKRQRAQERRQRAEERRTRRRQASGRPAVDGRRRGKQEPDTLGAYLKAQWDWPRVARYRKRWTKPFPEARRNAIPHFGKRMSDPVGIRNCTRCKGKGRLGVDGKPARLGPVICPLCEERIAVRQRSAELAQLQRGLPKRRLFYAPQRYDATNKRTKRRGR